MMSTVVPYQFLQHTYSSRTAQHQLTPLPLAHSQPGAPPPALVRLPPDAMIPTLLPMSVSEPIIHMQSRNTAQIQLPSVIAIFDDQKDIYQGLMLNCPAPHHFLQSTQTYRPQLFQGEQLFHTFIDTSGLRFHLYNPIVQKVFPWCDYIFLFHTGNEVEFRNKMNEIYNTGRAVKFYYVYDKSCHFIELNQFDPATHTRSEIFCVNTSRIKGILLAILNQISSQLVSPVNIADSTGQRLRK